MGQAIGPERLAVGRARIARAQAAMKGAGFDALLLVNSLNLVYLAGYQSSVLTLARPYYLFLPRRSRPVLLLQRSRASEARRHSWVDDVRTYDRLSVAPLAELAAIVRDLGLDGGRVGAELGFEQRLGLPPLEWERIVAELAPTRFEDAAALLWSLRAVKDADEIAALREAGRVTVAAYEQVFAELRPGLTDQEVVASMRLAQVARGAAAGWAMVGGGEGLCDLSVGTGIGRPYEPGEMVWLDAGCSVRGYWSDYSRAAVLGAALAEQRDAWEAIARLTAKGVALCRPGVPAREVAARCNEGVRRIAGALPVTVQLSTEAGRIGHGIGLDITEPPHVSETDATILEIGMVVSVEPGFATAAGIFHCEQNVLVTAGGPELLSPATTDLVEARA